MLELENLDVRTVTLGISILDCRGKDFAATTERIVAKIRRLSSSLNAVADEVSEKYGIPIVNRRVAVSPVALLLSGEERESDVVYLAQALDTVAQDLGIDFIGGFSALVHKGATRGDILLMESIPALLSATERICASVNVASSRTGINVDAILTMAKVVQETAFRTAHRDGIGCAKLVVFANAPEDNPFMAGAFHGVGEPEAVINVGVSGPGVVKEVVRRHPKATLGELAEVIKRTAFKITRVGELIGREVAEKLGVSFGIVDLSLAPTPRVGDSVAEILEEMGLERCGAFGSTLALALLTDACKKGGAMASSSVGGLSGAFIPVSEDARMSEAVEVGALSLEKLEAMTSVSSVGLDMIAIPGDTPWETIACIMADEIAIGVMNHKTVGVRLIPVPGKKAGEKAIFGGLLGETTIIPVNTFQGARFILRGGRVPAPLTSLKN
ncbi:MAG: PFL family protein [Candidatus Caldatribacterium sp.]|uniref:PFL family protein n=1 Tax=Candidatus Caldatribacterium sp. TaxID=2282143 RepID=UPI00299687DB|nr:PFL family protein [Candidatus Caldatribacterium sp.]MCX7730232.1 PFL family protein [Candidatus Caldatribacterium sp.]MDW8081032.1 PFL family protein [Candidatus Calescibacterium sp.]